MAGQTSQQGLELSCLQPKIQESSISKQGPRKLRCLRLGGQSIEVKIDAFASIVLGFVDEIQLAIPKWNQFWLKLSNQG